MERIMDWARTAWLFCARAFTFMVIWCGGSLCAALAWENVKGNVPDWGLGTVFLIFGIIGWRTAAALSRSQ